MDEREGIDPVFVLQHVFYFIAMKEVLQIAPSSPAPNTSNIPLIQMLLAVTRPTIEVNKKMFSRCVSGLSFGPMK